MAFPSAADFQFTDEHRFLCGLVGLEFERVTQISQMTQIFLTYSVRLTQIFRLPCPPLAKRGGLIPLPSPLPYHKGKGWSWRRYSSARVLVSQRSLCSKGLAGMLNQYFPISSWAFFKARILNSFSTRFFTSFSILSSIIWLRGRENGCQP